MRLKPIHVITATSVLTVMIVSVCAFYQLPRRSNRILERWETSNGSFDLRVTAYGENGGGFVPGAYYVFESRRRDSETWREILTFRHDDPIPIPKRQVRFVNDDVAFGWMFAVTTDKGSTWSKWSAKSDLPDWQCCNYGLIRDIELTATGSGKMWLDTTRNTRGVVPELKTIDFGRHWNP